MDMCPFRFTPFRLYSKALTSFSVLQHRLTQMSVVKLQQKM